MGSSSSKDRPNSRTPLRSRSKRAVDKAAADIAYLLTPSTGTASWGCDLRKFNCSTFALWFVGRIIPQNLISTLPNATHGGSAVQSGVSGDPPGNPNGKFFSPEGIWDYFKRWRTLRGNNPHPRRQGMGHPKNEMSEPERPVTGSEKPPRQLRHFLLLLFASAVALVLVWLYAVCRCRAANVRCA